MKVVLVVAALMLSACSSTTDSKPAPEADPHAVSTHCADLIVYGLRGQTQSATKNDGVGHEVLVTVDSLIAHLPRHSGTTVRLAAITYPALAEAAEAGYLHDIAEGKRLLTDALAKDAKACPNSRAVVIGYSEGAQVVHVTTAELPATAAKTVAAVALLADPLRRHDDQVSTESYGTGPLTGRGNAGIGKRFGAAIRDRVVTFCVKQDNVCNAPLGGRVGGISDAHREFYEKSTTAQVSGTRIASLIARHP